ncbi:hypothetical protein TbgDal_IX8200 [Trypanosoma brucei gambiense DAL972]|uniref:Uncharacterized protein n=1 Tax=Trypanosoma brucei gambiense (strain MHOM/CI/86/DAL972) TaxID=679716 RepID=C9ZZ95_TRYB9|nr:hypothetical protein TbgDal_IX8200 [Trypanosoma brucei gambiense DAL972]CBH14744.1 hypothetical protein TbgDal_IX8200 [Trypanosoma brucei gambiense DAL972]|eukprot:XP_011777010.1 hypothetical protein TbgDal_IX8200 [Trypanosoma brucei gambiense DAL972]
MLPYLDLIIYFERNTGRAHQAFISKECSQKKLVTINVRLYQKQCLSNPKVWYDLDKLPPLRYAEFVSHISWGMDQAVMKLRRFQNPPPKGKMLRMQPLFV